MLIIVQVFQGFPAFTVILPIPCFLPRKSENHEVHTISKSTWEISLTDALHSEGSHLIHPFNKYSFSTSNLPNTALGIKTMNKLDKPHDFLDVIVQVGRVWNTSKSWIIKRQYSEVTWKVDLADTREHIKQELGTKTSCLHMGLKDRNWGGKLG